MVDLAHDSLRTVDQGVVDVVVFVIPVDACVLRTDIASKTGASRLSRETQVAE